MIASSLSSGGLWLKYIHQIIHILWWAMAQIHSSNYPYSPVSYDSNTFIKLSISSSGLYKSKQNIIYIQYRNFWKTKFSTEYLVHEYHLILHPSLKQPKPDRLLGWEGKGNSTINFCDWFDFSLPPLSITQFDRLTSLYTNMNLLFVHRHFI